MTHLITLAMAALVALSIPMPVRAVQSLATEIQRTLQQEQLTGAVWATVTPDGGAVTGAAGLANADSGAAMRADNRVQVGSVAKVALAAGVLRLVTEGKLSLDTPVATLLPALSFTNRWEATDPIRVRHLLAHTAGLENFRLWHIFSLTARADTPLGAGFNAMLCVYPEQHKAFFVAMNTDSETADYDRFNKLLIDALHLPPAAPVVKPAAPAADIVDWLGI